MHLVRDYNLLIQGKMIKNCQYSYNVSRTIYEAVMLLRFLLVKSLFYNSYSYRSKTYFHVPKNQ